MLQNIRMSNFVILKWRPFEYKAKFGKNPLLIRSEIGIFDILLKDCTKKVLKLYKSVVIENFKLASLCDSNGIRTHKHLVRKRTLNHLAKLANSFST